MASTCAGNSAAEFSHPGMKFRCGSYAVLDIRMSRLCQVWLHPGGHTFKVGIRDSHAQRWHELKILFHGGDNGEPCATVMRPNED